MRAKEVHRVGFEAETNGLVIADHMLGERHCRELGRRSFLSFVEFVGEGEKRQIGRLFERSRIP